MITTYEPLHHKYRPTSFDELVGQDPIKSTLKQALISDRIAPAYIFSGPRGTGKTSSARILAKSLNCLKSEKATTTPCGQCELCKGISSGNALDVIEIDAASNTGVENIRELIERSRFAPAKARWKVYVIDECHMLSTAAFNALLKTLEEPPRQVVFILATTDPQRVLPTILSRCMRFDFRRIGLHDLESHLISIAKKEEIDISFQVQLPDEWDPTLGKINVGINGFGRIGRMVFRASLHRNDIDVVAINDLLDIDHLIYLLKYDSVHGNCDATIIADDDGIIVNGQKIVILSEKNPSDINWKNFGVTTVIESTGLFTLKADASKHLDGGAKNVIISAPSKDAPMFVMGVNHNMITPADNVVSNASCTTNCLAPVVKVLHDNFEVKEALMTTVHAATATQFTVDGPSRKNYRLGRSAINNIIPTSTGAAVAVTKVIPSLEGKITGMAFRIPTANVSVVDLTVKLSKSTSYDEVMAALELASKNELNGVLGFTTDKVVSQDFVGDPRTSIVDATAGIELNDTFFKLVIWYDNEAGYSNKLLDMAQHINAI